ncbi:MAG: hypothetical protein ABEJ55_06805 [Halanaeroarchaeum sp.]
MDLLTDGVNIRVLRPHDFDQEGAWVVGGVPFQRAELAPEDDVALHWGDDEVPLQTKVLAYWPDNSVKWLLVVARTDLIADRNDELELVRGEPALPEAPVTVERKEGEIRVSTGQMSFTVPREGSALLDSVTVGGRDMLDDPPELFAGTVDRDGRTRRYSDWEAGTFRTVEVEEEGPCRAIVRIEGTHVAADGSTFGPYTVRLYAHAGDTALRVAHNVVYDGYPDTDLIESMGLRFQTAIEDARLVGYGGRIGPVSRTYADRSEWGIHWEEVDLYQESANDYRVEKRIEPGKPAVKMEEGRRSRGWVDLTGTETGLAVGIRRAAEQYPKNLRVDPTTGSITAELWPERAEPLDLQRYSDTAYGLIYECPGEAQDRNTPAIPTMNAHGISKTHDLLLYFHDAEKGNAALAARMDAFNDPPRIAVSPERYAETGVLGRFTTEVPKGYERQAEWFERDLDYILQEQDRRGWYGMLDYGDIVRAYNHDIDQWRSDEGGHGWLNTEFQPDQWLWYAYLFTGRYDAFRFAEAMTRHTGDVDVIQTGPWWGTGSRHGVQHWSDGDREIRVSMPGARRLHYYLTGDERARDVIDLALRRYQTMQREEGRNWLGFTEQLYARADLGAALVAYYTAWEMTGSDHYEELLRNVADVLATRNSDGVPHNNVRLDLSTGEGEPTDDQPISDNMFLQFGGLQGMVELCDLGEFPELEETALSYAAYLHDRYSSAGPDDRDFGRLVRASILLAWAYRETGEEKYRDAVESAFAHHEVSFDRADWDEDVLVTTSAHSPPSAIAAFGRRLPYALEILDGD